MRELIRTVLLKEGYETISVDGGDKALELMSGSSFDLVISDIRMPGMGGMELLSQVKKSSPSTDVILITAYGSIENAVDAMKIGAADYLTKPFKIDELKLVVGRVYKQRKLSAENVYLKEELSARHKVEDFIAKNAQMVEVLGGLEDVAKAKATVLIQGESGTGKELIARGIHNLSERKEKVFVAVNCAALTETLLESELFGHEKSSFTGAISQRKGRFEIADGGSLFLDEIGEMSTTMQAKLLRVLQELDFERVGGTKTIHVDVRIITATNRDLQEAVREGSFREDLFYRLNVVPIHVPPLRERQEDIIPLSQFFLDKFNKSIGKGLSGFSPDAKGLLISYDWPGNVRELENAIERAVIVAKGEVLEADDLPLSLHPGAGEPKEIDFPVSSIKEMERRLILRALKLMDGNRTRTAEILGISLRTLQYKLKDYKIDS